MTHAEVAALQRFEDGAMDINETVELFQHLVDTGLAWRLQGFYGRTAVNLINAGLVKENYAERGSN